jgi:hypothetical protein
MTQPFHTSDLPGTDSRALFAKTEEIDAATIHRP